MKKFLSFILIACIILAAFMLTGCNKQENGKVGPEAYKENYGFDAYVDKKAPILGEWEEVLADDSNSDKTIWRFEDTATLNIIESVSGHTLTVGATYNFNQETKELIYMIIDTKQEYKVTVFFDGNKMFFVDETGETIKNFSK